MRTIEFRGLRTDGGGMVHGDLYHGLNGEVYINHVVQLDLTSRANKQTMVERESVGQFIGRIDIHGKKVYEDDLFKCQNGRVWRIEYDEAKSEFMASKAERRVEGTPLRNLEVVEVVGNIHESATGRK